MAAHGDRLGRAYWMASVLFLLSGGTGLAYEVIWFKRFSHVWGNSTLATAAVVASFLFALGIGARQLGRLADRVRSPLLWYGLCEIGIGFLALSIPFEIHSLLALSAALNLTIGAVAIVVSRGLPSAQPLPGAQPAAPAVPVDDLPAFAPIALYGTAAITGCAALVLQIVWTRQLALVLGGSTYAFTAMLCVVLTGIGVGSLVFHLWLTNVPNLLHAPALVMP